MDELNTMITVAENKSTSVRWYVDI